LRGEWSRIRHYAFIWVFDGLDRFFECAPGTKLWGLTFNNSDFHGDFHTSLLYMLQRCPHVCSLTFTSNTVVEDDALLGHLIGQIPSTVRFVAFKNCLSKESIQAMCILLRRHNEAFAGDFVYSGAFLAPRNSESYRGSESGKTPVVTPSKPCFGECAIYHVNPSPLFL